MGTGKTTVAKIISEKLFLDFFDTDKLICQQVSMKVRDIFKTYGEKKFRSLESKVLENLLLNYKNLTKRKRIIATGGGIVLSAENRKYLKKYSFPILLTASPKNILERIEGKNRPLLSKNNNKLIEIKKLLRKREKFYSQFQKKINTDHKSPEEVADEIIKNYIVNN